MDSSSKDNTSNDESLIKVHGSLMLVAWLFFATNGIFTSRYLKNMLSKRINGYSVWFGLHQICMLATWCLSVISTIIMFVGHGFEALKKDKIKQNPHSLFGILTIILVFFQPLMACFQPQKTSSYRKWFDFMYSLIELTCIILSLCAIFLATNLEQAHLDTSSKTLMYFFIGFLIICDQVMSIIIKNNLEIPAKVMYLTFIVGTFVMTCLAMFFLLLWNKRINYLSKIKYLTCYMIINFI